MKTVREFTYCDIHILLIFTIVIGETAGGCFLKSISKTKELLIDFRKQPPAVSPITIDGEIVERVEKCKYLGIILDNKLKFDSNVLNIYKNVIAEFIAYKG